jgi:hypothetical protein
MPEIVTETSGGVGVIEVDVPCEKCGYNLRGLTPPRLCPECGHDAERSYRAWRRRMQPKPPPDPQWAQRMRQAAWLSLAAFGLMLLMQVLPRGMFWKPYRNAPFTATPGRVVLLSLGCVWWTLAWAGVWRLATVERIPRLKERAAYLSGAVRWLCTGYLFMPVVWAWGTWSSQDGPYPVLYPAVSTVLLIGGLAGGLALFARVGQVLRRGGATVAAVCAWVLALAVPLTMLLPLGAFTRDPSSLGLMTRLPVHAFGAAELHYELVRAIRRLDLDEWVLWVFLLIPLIAASLFVRMLVAFRRSRISELHGTR